MQKSLMIGIGLAISCGVFAATPAGLIGRYSFDRPYGLYEPDTTGQSGKLKVTRDDWEFRELSKREPGLFGNALRLAPRAAVVGMFPADREFTIQLWLKPEQKNTRDTMNISDFFRSEIDGQGRFVLTAAGKNIAAALQWNQWNAIAIAGDGRNLSLYVNGKLAGRMAMPSGSPRGKMFSLSRLNDPSSYYRGQLDELRFYGRALEEKELQKLANPEFYKQEFLPVCDAGIAHTVWLPQQEIQLNGKAGKTDRVEWRIVRAPAGSKPVFSAPKSLQTKFKVDKPGDYELELTAYGRDGIARSRTRAVLFEAQPAAKAGTPFIGKLKAGTITDRRDVSNQNSPPNYTQDYIKKHFPEPEIAFQKKGFASERFLPPPPPYSHPRILFNPEELESIRLRLNDTRSGQANYEYAMAQLDNRFRKLNPGDPLPLMVAAGTPRSKEPGEYEYASALINESFRALIEADSVAARRLIDQMVRQADEQQNMMNQPKLMKSDDWRVDFHHVVGRTATPLMYDFLYPWMTESERAKIRAVLSRVTRDKWVTGMNTVVAQGRHNWLCWCAGDLLLAVTAIEDEEGYPVESAKELRRTFRHWVTSGVYPGSGAAFEGMGKNSLTSQNLVILTKRGEPLIASQAAYNHYAKFLLGCMHPFGGMVCKDDLWGGSRGQLNYQDAVAVKYAYPNDPAIDLVYRNAAGDDYRGWKLGGTTYRYCGDVLPLIFGTDYIGGDNPQKPLDYFATEINLATSRSSWNKDAAFLYFLPRMHGGHNAPARSTFVFSALGRDWSIYPTGHNDKHALQHSVVTYDGKNQFAQEDSVMLAYEVTPGAMLAACDLKYVHNGNAPDKMTNNDFRLDKLDLPWENIPKVMWPFWYTGNRPNVGEPRENQVWRSSIRYAYRSAGLVRGAHSYAIIADDFDVDGHAHKYRWQMVLAPEVAKHVAIDGSKAIVTDPKTGNRLLVQALYPESIQWKVEPSPDAKKYGKYDTLSFTRNTQQFNTAILLVPLKKGESVPDIKNNAVVFADGVVDTLSFKPGQDGRSRVRVSRNGTLIAELK